MGGFGSGNYCHWGGKLTLNDCRCLDINRMVKLDAIQEQCFKAGGIWAWVDRETGEELSKIGYECNTLDLNNSYLRLSYKFTDTDQSFDYKIRLVRTFPRYGGIRFWFICPERGKRVGKLYLVPSDGRFVSRHVYKLSYASQMRGKLNRAIDKKWKIMSKVDGISYPERPKGMHQKTFDKICTKFIKQDELCKALLIEKISYFS